MLCEIEEKKKRVKKSEKENSEKKGKRENGSILKHVKVVSSRMKLFNLLFTYLFNLWNSFKIINTFKIVSTTKRKLEDITTTEETKNKKATITK